MINDEIIGGLVSALSRGQSLESAMMTFYNAGYKKEEIEDSAREVYNQVGPQIMGVNGSLQETLNDIAIKAGVPVTPTEQPAATEQPNNTQDKIVLQTPTDKKTPDSTAPVKEEDKSKQTLPVYTPPLDGSSQNTTDITNRIEEAIKGLRPVNIPSRIEIVHKNIDSPTVVQHVSDYSGPKSVNNAVTYVLITILILLLIALGAIFLFKDDLIKLFNNLGIA